MATFVNDLRLKEIATGDEAGTWGTSTNTNLELIAEAFSFGTEASFSSDADATTTIADGATDPARSLYLKVTSGVSLSAIRTLTIAPNTVSKVWIIENATSGSQSINISQGSGSNVTIPNGDVRVVYSDGAGSGAAVVDAFTDLNVSGTLTANGGVKVDNITIDGTEIDLSSGDLTIDVAGDIILDADGGQVIFKDGGTQSGFIDSAAGNFILKSTTSDADMKFQGNDGGSAITALTLDMSNAGTASFNHDIKLGDGGKSIYGADQDLVIQHTGSNGNIANDTGNLTLDVAGDIILDAAGGEIILSAAGGSSSPVGNISMASNNITLSSTVSNADIIFKGNDGGSTITALTLDMSNGGAATFLGTVTIQTMSAGAGTNALRFNTSTGAITFDSSSQRYKDNIRDSVYGLSDVLKLRSTMFEYKDTGRTDVGLIAEELNEVIPELVTKDKENIPESVSYDRLVSVLIKSIQELEARIVSLES